MLVCYQFVISTDAAIFVIPAWQHTPRKRPSQEFLFIVFEKDQLRNVAISGSITSNSISERMEREQKMAMEESQHKYTNRWGV